MDKFSKCAHFMAIDHPYFTTTIATTFVDNVYKLHSLSAFIVRDRDIVFLSQFGETFFSYQEAKLYYSIAYHPQIIGKTKAANKFLENYLRCINRNT
jgi:hypothetical protein